MKCFKILILLLSFSFFAHACPFCNEDIIANQVVLESAYLRVLIDYAPLGKGHLLVVPKRHVVKAHELSIEEWEELPVVISQIVEMFKQLLQTDQYIILEKNGRDAFQSVPHVHFHLLPVQPQTWSKISDIFGQRKRLTEEELTEEVDTLKSYFLERNSCSYPFNEIEL